MKNYKTDLKKILPPFLPRIQFVTLLSMLFIAQHTRADADDTFNVTAGVSVQHDDNLFRKSSNLAKADDITVATLGLKIDKRYSLQRFELEASLVDNRYRTFDYNDFTALNYAAAWHWSLTPYLHGNLSSERIEALNSFSDNPESGTRNLRVDQNQRFDGVLEVSGSWRVLGGITQTKRSNSELSNPEGDIRLNSAEGGLRYDFRSGSSLSYIWRSGRGDYFNRVQPIEAARLDNHFDQRENEVRLVWPITAKTTVDARAAYLARTHAHFSERDFAGIVGNLNVNWAITDKTSLTAGYSHELSSYQTTAATSYTSSYVSTDRLTFSPLWKISEKTALRARLNYAHQRYLGATDNTLSNRVDTLRTSMIGLEWKPLSTLSLGASLQNEKRTSNQPGLDYKDTIAGVTAQLSF